MGMGSICQLKSGFQTPKEPLSKCPGRPELPNLKVIRWVRVKWIVQRDCQAPIRAL